MDLHGSITTMLFLVTDTSGKDGFVGLARTREGARSDHVDVIGEVPLAGGTFSAQLVPQISGLLGSHGLEKTDIDGFIVVSGPGSFTGLRVGLAAIKALAEILKNPIVPVSLLLVLGKSSMLIAAGQDGHATCTPLRYAVALDAGRKEAYVGEYEVVVEGNSARSFQCGGERLLDLESLVQLMESGTARWLATPDPALATLLSERLDAAGNYTIIKTDRPRSSGITTVGWQKLKAGKVVSPEQLDANYIRRSDAEIFAKPRP